MQPAIPRFRLAGLCFSLLFPLCALSALAQVETARITGKVSDTSGGVITGVTVTITNARTNRQAVVPTNDHGQYLAVSLPSGEYHLTAEMAGFSKAVRSGIILQVHQTAVVDFVLQVGEVSERVQVTADAPLLNTAEPAQGQVIDNRKILELPLNGRDYLQLALLSAGAVQTLTGGRMGGFSAGSLRASQNNYLLDGIDNNNVQINAQGNRGDVVKPSVDAIQEFKVLTNTYSAEFGRAGGGVVTVTLKSGTNQFHGTVFEFLRNEVLDARNFFARPDASKPPFKRNQFGFSFGGPLIKNKTFFFGDYEGTRVRESRTVLSSVPTLRMRAGDFSELATPIFDPATYNQATGARQPFPNNSIPANRIDPLAQRLANLYPAPQTNQLTQNFLYNPPDNENVHKFDVRIDHFFGAKDNIYYRLSYHRSDHFASPNLPAPAFGGALATSDLHDPGWNTGLVWNHTFSPHLITSTRVGWNKFFSKQDSIAARDSGKNLNAEYGVNGVDQNLPGGFARFTMTGFTTLGIGPWSPLDTPARNRQIINDTTWIRGQHTIKAGGNLHNLWSSQYDAEYLAGEFMFNGNYTRNPAGNVGGNAFADFLLGIPRQSSVSTWFRYDARAWLNQFYIQDEWRVMPRLMLNFGLRYELFLPFTEINNGFANFDIDTDPSNPRIVVASDGSRADRATIGLDTNNFAPRFGFAYNLTKGTVLRGGYGIYTAFFEPAGGAEWINGNPPFAYRVDVSTDGIQPVVLLKDGIPPGTLAPENARNLRLSSFERKPELPYIQQWNFNVQRQFGQDWLWEFGYYGNKANHLIHRWDANFALPGPGDINQRRRYQSTLFPGTNVIISPLSLMNRHQFDGNSLFHSFQTKVERRFSAGLSLLGSYIWSKAIGDVCGNANPGNAPGCGIQNPLNRRLERSLDNQHVAHRAVTSFLWELPFGTNKRWGSGWDGLTEAFFGGWNIGGIVTLTTGTPYSVTVSGDPANTGGTNRPDLVGNPELSSGERSVARWFNTAAFAANKPFAYGNSGRNILVGPAFNNIDFAALKDFRVTEAVTVQFRFEAFNFTNTPHFAVPTFTLGTPDFGRITSAGRPRNLQFGLKLVF